MNDFSKIVVKILENSVAGLRLDSAKMETTLSDLGIDSLDVMVVLMDIQEATGVHIPEGEMDNLKTPAQISDFLSAQ